MVLKLSTHESARSALFEHESAQSFPFIFGVSVDHEGGHLESGLLLFAIPRWKLP